jgi:hypothetical protein
MRRPGSAGFPDVGEAVTRWRSRTSRLPDSDNPFKRAHQIFFGFYLVRKVPIVKGYFFLAHAIPPHPG